MIPVQNSILSTRCDGTARQEGEDDNILKEVHSPGP
jgi:hypothetical protein